MHFIDRTVGIITTVITVITFLFGFSFSKPDMELSYVISPISIPKDFELCERQACNENTRYEFFALDVINKSSKTIENYSMEVSGIARIHSITINSSSSKINSLDSYVEIDNDKISFPGIKSIPRGTYLRVEIIGDFKPFHSDARVSASGNAEKIAIHEGGYNQGVALMLAENYFFVIFSLIILSILSLFLTRKFRNVN